MHELGIVTEVLRIARETAAAAGSGGRIESVRVAVGELTAVEPELLKFGWEALTAECAEAGSVLEVEWRAAKQSCRQCRAEKRRPPRDWLPICPDCGSRLDVEGGFELEVLSVQLLVDEPEEIGGTPELTS